LYKLKLKTKIINQLKLLSQSEEMSSEEIDEEYIVVNCPHCEDTIIIYKNEINCRIFRHAVYKKSKRPVNPHLSESKCKSLIKSKKVYGCCKPFKLNDSDKAEICDYI